MKACLAPLRTFVTDESVPTAIRLKNILNMKIAGNVVHGRCVN